MASLTNDDRWCPLCGGETGHVRQRDAQRQRLHTYLVCRLPGCGLKRWLMTYDETTGETETEERPA